MFFSCLHNLTDKTAPHQSEGQPVSVAVDKVPIHFFGKLLSVYILLKDSGSSHCVDLHRRGETVRGRGSDFLIVCLRRIKAFMEIRPKKKKEEIIN